MNAWITHIQPLGLMRMRLIHHQEHHQGPQAIHDVVCHPTMFCCHMKEGRKYYICSSRPGLMNPHEQLHGVCSGTEQGSIPIPHTLHEEHADCTIGTGAGTGDPRCAGPILAQPAGSCFSVARPRTRTEVQGGKFTPLHVHVHQAMTVWASLGPYASGCWDSR